MEKLNWGIIGLGGIAQKFSEGFFDTPNAKLLAVASRNLEHLEKFKDQFNIEQKFSFNNYEDLINCKEIDIVYIALPNSFHHHWIVRSLKNKKNVLVEKPATLNTAESKDISENLSNENLFFGEAFMYRNHPQIKLVLDMIVNNEIGNLLSMESSFGVNILTKKKFYFFEKKKKIDKNNRLFNKTLGGGCILDLGCYPSSFSLLIGSLIKKLDYKKLKISKINKEIGETGVDIDSCGELLFEEGFKSKINASFKKDIGKKTIINGEKGSLILNDTWLGNDNIVKINNNYKKVINIEKNKNIYSFQIATISKNILKGIYKPVYPSMSIEETMLNMKILENWLDG
ncbi:Gfo/Idh/MocA family oxidoreductase [Candidatus Pelagibacter ubique]|jgi:predicted dehydrogenase|nr:Gfo/Idh/MocA family oxidoreductase [Candidatus Pelagibacter ubique]